jgi:hypothetical protein
MRDRSFRQFIVQFVVALGSFTAFWPNDVQADGTLRTVALSSTLGPPADSQFTFPTINNLGDTAFSGLRNASYADVWMKTAAGDTRLVASAGASVPGLPAGATFQTVGAQIINDAGHVIAGGRVQGTGVTLNNQDGLWADDAFGHLQLIARTGNSAPGADPGVVFHFLSPNIWFNNAGNALIGANLSGPGVDASNDGGIWWTNGAGTLTQIAREGQPAPGTSGSFLTVNSSLMAMNDSGNVVFFSNLANGATGFGVWAWNHVDGLSLVAVRGQVIPGQPLTNTFGSVLNPAINDAGDIAFFDASSSGDRDWVRQSNGTFRQVAKEGMQAPGTPIGVLFSQLNSAFVINRDGHIATWASLIGVGVTTANNKGI